MSYFSNFTLSIFIISFITRRFIYFLCGKVSLDYHKLVPRLNACIINELERGRVYVIYQWLELWWGGAEGCRVGLMKNVLLCDKIIHKFKFFVSFIFLSFFSGLCFNVKVRFLRFFF